MIPAGLVMLALIVGWLAYLWRPTSEERIVMAVGGFIIGVSLLAAFSS